MANPVTLGIGAGAMGLTALGGYLQGQGAEQAAQAQAGASTYKAGVALLNRQINLQNAAWATESGDVSAMESGLKSKQQIGATKTQQAASGLDVNSGTGEAVRETQSTVAGYDQNVIRFDAAKTAYGYEAKATMDQAESQLDLYAAKTETEAGEIAKWSSYINAGSSVASKWMQGKSIGMWG